VRLKRGGGDIDVQIAWFLSALDFVPPESRCACRSAKRSGNLAIPKREEAGRERYSGSQRRRGCELVCKEPW